MGRFTVEGNKLVADDKVVYHAIPIAHHPNHIREGEDWHFWRIPTESGHDLQLHGAATDGRIKLHLTGVAREGWGERNLSMDQFKPLHGGPNQSVVVIEDPEQLDHYVEQVSRIHMKGD
jgi:hypothetical protein